MKRQDKIDYLFNNHLGEWLKARDKAGYVLSEEQPMFCCCGKLATGFHEQNCRQFQNKVDTLAMNYCKPLLPTKEKQNAN